MSPVRFSALWTIAGPTIGLCRYRPRLHAGQVGPRSGRFCKLIDSHDVLFSYGECFPETVPTTGHRWRPIRKPTVLSEWRPSMPHRDVFTTVMNWTSYKDVTYRGQSYGQKDVEFRRFIELPRRVAPTVLEIAINEGKTAGHLTVYSLTRDGVLLTLQRFVPIWRAIVTTSNHRWPSGASLSTVTS
jgi:hypothetical protein